jgi:UDP-2,4-diacetamido-2,4,6-trideoxy-beta-L-altropyranose hydrolase
MQCVIRVDSSCEIGLGHLMRCLCLADYLAANASYKITFICRNFPGNLSSLVLRNGHDLRLLNIQDEHALQFVSLSGTHDGNRLSIDDDRKKTIEVIKELGQVDLLLVDSYALDHVWEKRLGVAVKKIMVIDDLANRKHHCDFLLDQNFFFEPLLRYKNKVPSYCKLLLGPKFALLREEFSNSRKVMKPRIGKLNNILVTMGGSDPNSLAMKVVKILLEYKKSTIKPFNIRVILGPSDKNAGKMGSYFNEYDIDIIQSSSKISEHFLWADLCIGTSGSTNWERCALGLPAIVIMDGDNEREIAENLHVLGVVKACQNDDNLQQSITVFLNGLCENTLVGMSKKAMKLVDCCGSQKVSCVLNQEL